MKKPRFSANEPPQYQAFWQRFFMRPSTRIGWWSVILSAIFVVLFIVNVSVFTPAADNAPWRQTILPFYAITMLSCGFVGGLVGLIAITRWHEGSWLVWLTLIPGVFVLIFVLGEFLAPH